MITKLIRLGCVAAGLAGSLLLQAAIPPAENLLPADTLAFFTVPDCNRLTEAMKTSPPYRFWNDEAMKPFHDKFMAKFNEKFVGVVEKDLGAKVTDFMALLQGQFTMAVTQNGSAAHDDTPPGLVLLLDAKDKSASLKTNLAALTKKWTDSGRLLRTDKIHGLTFTILPLSSNDFSAILPKRPAVQELGKQPKPEKPGEMYFAQFESLLIVGNSIKAVEPVAAHLTGGNAPLLAEEANFAADKPAQFRDSPAYYGWINGSKLFSMLAQTPPDEGESASPFASAFTAGKIIGATGLASLKSASFTLRESPEGSSVTVHISAPEAERAGLLKIFALPAKDASAPPFVPAEVVKFSRVRLDGKLAWAELLKMAAGISPQGIASFNSVIDMANSFAQAKNPGFDLRTALFGNLGDDIITYQKPLSGDSLAALADPPTLYLVAVANPETAITAIKTIAGLSAPQDASTAPREFLGRKIHAVALRPAAVQPGTPPAPRFLHVSSSAGYLALSQDAPLVEEFLRSAEGKVKPLSDNLALTEAAQHVGGAGGGMFGFENQRETMRATFKAFKNSAAADSAMKLFPPAFRDWADFTLLPDYLLVQKYFNLSVYAGSANADGLTMKIFSPHPAQRN